MGCVVGLTGQTGAGKTTVSSALRNEGIQVLDADQIAREVIEGSKICLGDLALEFGMDILDLEGNLNRRKLGAKVFSDRASLARLNAITYPHIMERISEEVARWRKQEPDGLLVLDAPTLYEAGADKLCDKVAAVLAPPEIRLKRIMERDGLDEPEARDRIRSQNDDEFFLTRADYILINNGTREELIRQALDLMRGVAARSPEGA